MKGVVVYDSYYGNTKIVAEAIAEQLKVEGHMSEPTTHYFIIIPWAHPCNFAEIALTFEL